MSFLWVHEVQKLLREIVMTHTKLQNDNYRGNETKSHGSYTLFSQVNCYWHKEASI